MRCMPAKLLLFSYRGSAPSGSAVDGCRLQAARPTAGPRPVDGAAAMQPCQPPKRPASYPSASLGGLRTLCSLAGNPFLASCRIVSCAVRCRGVRTRSRVLKAGSCNHRLAVQYADSGPENPLYERSGSYADLSGFGRVDLQIATQCASRVHALSVGRRKNVPICVTIEPRAEGRGPRRAPLAPGSRPFFPQAPCRRSAVGCSGLPPHAPSSERDVARPCVQSGGTLLAPNGARLPAEKPLDLRALAHHDVAHATPETARC
jgi:hypothetical protein